MSLVSNFIGGISSVGLGGAKVTPSFDLDDKTFADLLKKQIAGVGVNEGVNGNETSFLNLGAPAGLDIEPFEGIDFSDKINNSSETSFSNNENDFTTSETVTFFSSLLDNNINGNGNKSEIFDFAKKQASNFYNRYSKSAVNDLQDFVEDIKEIIK